MENYLRKSKNGQKMDLGSSGFNLKKFKWDKVIELQCHLTKRTQYDWKHF